jgi:hypothetical protein
MVGTRTLEKTGLAVGTAREAAVGDLQAEASEPYLTHGELERS